VNKMGFCNGPSWVNPFRAISIFFLFFFPSSFLVRADAAFSRPGLQLHLAGHGVAVNDGREATGAAGASLRAAPCPATLAVAGRRLMSPCYL